MTDALYRFGFLLLVFGGLLALNADGFAGSASGVWLFGMLTMLLGALLVWIGSTWCPKPLPQTCRSASTVDTVHPPAAQSGTTSSHHRWVG